MEIKNKSSSMGAEWISAAGAAIGALGNIIGTGMTNKRMRAAQRRQFEYSTKLMDLAQQYNVENFNMENAYNTPLKQRERMKAAGLNPNFVDGLSPVVGQMDSVSNPSGPAGDVQPYDFNSVANAAATFASIKRENDLAKSQIEVNDSVVDKNLADASKAENDVKFMWDYQAPNVNSQTLSYNQQIEESVARVNEINRNIEFTREKVDAYVESVQSQIEKNQADINNMEELRDFVRKRLPHEIDKLDADTKVALVDAYCKGILAKNDQLRVKIEQQNANSNSLNAQSNRISALANQLNADTNSRNGKALRALYGAQERLTNAQHSFTDSQNLYQVMMNELTAELRESDLDYALKNAMLWKLISDKEYIESQKFRNDQEAELFSDTYYFQLLKQIPGIGVFMK